MRSLPHLLALSLCCTLPAQLPPGAFTFAPGENMIPWPAAIGTGVVRDLSGVFWHTNDNLGAFGLRGTASALAVAPGISSAVRPVDLTTIAADVVTLPLGGDPASNQHDGLLFSGLPGVDLGIAFCGSDGEPDVTLVTHPGWSRATMLAAHVDAPGVIDVIGKAFSGSTLLRTRFDQGTLTQVPGVAIGGVIRDLCFVKYNADAVADVAVLTDTELRIVDLAGNTLLTLSVPTPGGAIEPVPQAGQQNAIAWLRRKVAPAGWGWELLHVSPAGVEAPQTVTLLVADFVLGGFGAGDFDGDGVHDVAIQDGGNSVRLVRNRGGGTHFANADAMAPLTIGTIGGVQGQASVRDYDHDGGADLLVPLAAGGAHWLVLKKGMRSHFDPLALTFGDLFGDVRHENMNGDVLEIDLATDVMGDFSELVIKGYTVDETLIPGGQTSLFLAFGDSLTVEAIEVSGMAVFDLDGSAIHHPQLMFIHVQLFGGPPDVRPSFVTGGTIDNNALIQATSTYLSSHAETGAEPRDITRHVEAERRKIGFHVRQKFLPLQ